MLAYKGFDENLKCRGFQYEVGKEYETDEDIRVCYKGFHACEDPLDVFAYYSPDKSRYCLVEQSGVTDRSGDDSKVASSKIKIVAEIGLPGLIRAKFDYVYKHCTTEHTDPQKATAGDYGAATYRGTVSVGPNGCGLVRGNNIKIRGGLAAVLVLCVENDDDYNIAECKSFIVDGESVKADTWYTLENAALKECSG